MAKETLDAVITIRCTENERLFLAEKAWKGRTSISAMLRPAIKKTMKGLKNETT